MLEPGEREAVCGDLAEAGESGGRALRDVVGLVVRRQAGLWKGWRPWAALGAVAVPFGMWLGERSSALGRSYDYYLWVLGNYRAIDPAMLREAGFSVEARGASLVFGSLVLMGQAWSSGFVLGWMSRRAVAVNGVLFGGMLLVGGFLGAPRYRYRVDGEVYSLVSWYSVLLPLALLAILVWIPSVWGMQQAFIRTKEEDR